MDTKILFDKLSIEDFDIPNLKVIIFDFDNTLYDNIECKQDWRDVVLKKVEGFLSFLPEEERKSLMNKYGLYNTKGRFFEKLLRLFSAENMPFSTKDFRELSSTFIFDADWSKTKTLSNDFLNSLSKKYTLYILSNSSESVVKYFCEKMGIDTSYFKKIIQNKFDPKDFSKKPDILDIISDEGISANQVVVVGDSEYYDIQPAKEIGANTILLYGQWGESGEGYPCCHKCCHKNGMTASEMAKHHHKIDNQNIKKE